MRSIGSSFVSGGLAAATGGLSLAGQVGASALIGGIGYGTYNLVNGSNATLEGYAQSMIAGAAAPAIARGISMMGSAISKGISKVSSAFAKGAGKAVSNKSIVIGEGMQDIKTVAKQLQSEGVDAKWYQAWSKNFPNNRPMTSDELNAALARNQRWIDSKIKQGYDIYNIGTDPLRTTRSPFYELEQSRINKYGYQTIDITGRRP